MSVYFFIKSCEYSFHKHIITDIRFLDNGKIVVGKYGSITYTSPFERVPDFFIELLMLFSSISRDGIPVIVNFDMLKFMKTLISCKKYITEIEENFKTKTEELEREKLFKDKLVIKMRYYMKKIKELENSLSKQQEEHDLEIQSLKTLLSKQQEDHDLEIQSLKTLLSKQKEDYDLKIYELSKQQEDHDLEIQSLKTLLSKQKEDYDLKIYELSKQQEDYDLKILKQEENKTKIISVEDISKSDKSFDVDNLKDIISEHYKEIHLLKILLSKQKEGSDFKTLLLKQQEEKDLKSLSFKRYEENKRKIISVEDIQKSEFDIDKIKDVITEHYKEINLLKSMYGNT
jgi:hypothetical protein